MKQICWTLVIFTAFSVGHPALFDASDRASRYDFSDLVFDQRVADNLALLFSQFDTELVLCLEGERRDSALHITDFRMPHILLSEPGRVQAAGCKSDSKTVGTWHNHPTVGVTLTASSAEALARNCYLSRTDIGDFVRRTSALITVVSCAPRTYAYWKRADVESVSDDVALLSPPSRQLVQDQLRDDPGASTLTQARAR